MTQAGGVHTLAPGTPQDEDAWAIQWRHYVTLDEYVTHEPVTYPHVPGHQHDVNQHYALVRLHHGSFAIIARNMNCFYAHDEQTRIVETCHTPEQIREGMRRFAEMKQGAFYGCSHAREREDELER
jgi:hypothetical protein